MQRYKSSGEVKLLSVLLYTELHFSLPNRNPAREWKPRQLFKTVYANNVFLFSNNNNKSIMFVFLLENHTESFLWIWDEVIFKELQKPVFRLFLKQSANERCSIPDKVICLYSIFKFSTSFWFIFAYSQKIILSSKKFHFFSVIPTIFNIL